MTKQKQRVVVRVQKKELHAKAHKRAMKKWDNALWNKKIDILVERLALIRREDVVNFI